MDGGQQRRLARHGNRRWRQAGAQVGVERRVGLQVALAQIAVEGRAQAVDDGRIGLQRHADAQPVHEHARDPAAVGRRAGFLLDDGRQHQRFIDVAQRAVGRALLPGCGQALAHCAVRAAQHREVGAALAVGIGVGVEAPFGGLAGGAEQGHHFGVARAGGGRLQRLGLRQLGAELAEGPAFDEAHHGQGFIAPHHLVQQAGRRDAAPDFVAAGADAARLAGPAERFVQQPR